MLSRAPGAMRSQVHNDIFQKRVVFPQASDCGFSNSRLRTQGGLQATKSQIQRPVAHTVAHTVARQFSAVLWDACLSVVFRRGDVRYTNIVCRKISSIVFFAPPGARRSQVHNETSQQIVLFPTASECGFSNSRLPTQGGLQATKSQIQRPVAHTVAHTVARQFAVVL
jgi:hypothetical protein